MSRQNRGLAGGARGEHWQHVLPAISGSRAAGSSLLGFIYPEVFGTISWFIYDSGPIASDTQTHGQTTPALVIGRVSAARAPPMQSLRRGRREGEERVCRPPTPGRMLAGDVDKRARRGLTREKGREWAAGRGCGQGRHGACENARRRSSKHAVVSAGRVQDTSGDRKGRYGQKARVVPLFPKDARCVFAMIAEASARTQGRGAGPAAVGGPARALAVAWPQLWRFERQYSCIEHHRRELTHIEESEE
ncbi:hypothetical protein B0H14DRAFT_1302333 [Mycena olivaceomarginata]|nr:hypothetical protein B0H14DRAFT_1302333 [Mycena olivaceomarginata]